MNDTSTRDAKIALAIIALAILFLFLGWMAGTGSASGVACRNLGYDSGHMVSYLTDARIICESGYDIAIPDMWIAP